MLGRYNAFPHAIHGIARFAFLFSTRILQKAIVETAGQLNDEIFHIKDFTPFASFNYQVSFEFGIAENMTFNYLDQEELQRIQEEIEAKPFPVIDILSVIRYHTIKKGRRTPLRFDYNLLRFTFSKKTMELFVSHERGNRRISIEDFIRFLTTKIDRKLEEKREDKLAVEYLRSL